MFKALVRVTLPLLAACAAITLAGCGGGGSSSSGGSGQSVFNLPPNGVVISSVAPATGPIGGGTIVDLTGTGFAQSTPTVYVGANQAANTLLQSDTHLRITIPPTLNPGSVDIRVVNAAGISAVQSTDRFTYTGSAGGGGGGGVPQPPVQYHLDLSFGGSSNGAVMQPPAGIGVDLSNNIWAVDNSPTGPRLWEFNEAGTLISERPILTSTATALALVADYQTNGHVYVAWMGPTAVMVTRFTNGQADGRQTLQDGTLGGLAVDTNSNLYAIVNTVFGPALTVSDSSFTAVGGALLNVSTVTGVGVTPGGVLMVTDAAGNLSAVSLVTNSATSTVLVGDSAKDLTIPRTEGFAYFLDDSAGIGRKVNVNGIEVAAIGDLGGPGQLNHASALAVDGITNIAVVGDTAPGTDVGRILLFSPPSSGGGGPPPPPSP